MQKKILILGAGVYQVPLILKAKEMGLYTIAASYAGPYPGLAIADEVWEIDTTDYHAPLRKAASAGYPVFCCAPCHKQSFHEGSFSFRRCFYTESI